MKKTLLALGAIAFTTLSFSQQQIGNSDLEAWEVVASPDEEPVNWSSFLTASGSLAGFASSQLTKETDVRPGSTGMYSARIFSNSVLGVIANGNLTVGRINMGSATPTNANNYNSSVIADANFSEALTDEPDSIVFWVKFTPVNAADSGRVSAITHDSYAHRDPIDAASIPHTRAMSMYNFATTNGQWVRKAFPFNYTGAATTTDFILLTFATNKTPGGGSDNDQMWIDDISLIYNPGGANGQIVANVDNAVTDEDVPVIIDVLANDTDPEGDIDASSVTVTGAPANGTTSINTTTGEITYTPNSGFTGVDYLEYEVCDNGSPATCDTSGVYITVDEVNSIDENAAEFAGISIQNDQLVITADAGVTGTAAIYLASGQLLWSGDISESYTFTQGGMYFVRLDTNSGTMVRRFNHY